MNALPRTLYENAEARLDELINGGIQLPAKARSDWLAIKRALREIDRRRDLEAADLANPAEAQALSLHACPPDQPFDAQAWPGQWAGKPFARITLQRPAHTGLIGLSSAPAWTLHPQQQGTVLADLLREHQGADAPSADAIATDPAASFWIKAALAGAMRRDPVDAAKEAQTLAAVLRRRAGEILRAAQNAVGLTDARSFSPASTGRAAPGLRE